MKPKQPKLAGTEAGLDRLAVMVGVVLDRLTTVEGNPGSKPA